MTKEENNCVSCVRKDNCFRTLSIEELERMNVAKNTIQYKKGETIIKQGTEFTHVISFNEGFAKLNINVEGKKNLIIGLIKPSEILGGPGMFVDNRYSFSITALTDSKICLINKDVFKNVFHNNDRFSEAFLIVFSNRYIWAIKRLVTLTQKQMHGRVADAILFLADTIHQKDSFELILSRQELAEFTCMSKESVSRIIKDLNEEGTIITKGRRLDIINRDKLQRLCTIA